MVVQELPEKVRRLQKLLPSLAITTILFAVIAFLMAPVGEPEEMAKIENALLLALTLLAAGGIPAFFIARMNMIGKLRDSLSGRKPEECLESIAATYLQIGLIGTALAEIIGFFGLGIVLFTGNWLAGLAALLALLVEAVLYPRLSTFQTFAVNVAGRYGL